MKFKISLKNKEVSLDADVEQLVAKKMDQDEKRYISAVDGSQSLRSEKKTRYQIKQEEKRKNLELKMKLEQEREAAEIKRNMLIVKWLGIAFAILMTLCIVMSFLE